MPTIPGDLVEAQLITYPVMQNALIDYIVTTPNNFNANLFREFLANPYAQGKLIDNYMKKITPEKDDPDPVEPALPTR